MLKMTMHCDHTIFRRFSEFRFSLGTRCSYGYHAVFRSMTVFFYVFSTYFPTYNNRLNASQTNISIKKFQNQKNTFFLFVK